MKLNEIRAMLVPGSRWLGVRNPPFPASSSSASLNGAIRTVERVETKNIVYRIGEQRMWSPFPKASEIIEARDGFLSYVIPNSAGQIQVALTRQEGC